MQTRADRRLSASIGGFLTYSADSRQASGGQGDQDQGCAGEKIDNVVLVQVNTGKPHAGSIEARRNNPARGSAMEGEHERQQQRIGAVQRGNRSEPVRAQMKY